MLELRAYEIVNDRQAAAFAISTRTNLGRLNASADGFDEAIAQAGSKVLDDARQVLLDCGPQTFEGCQSIASSPSDPRLQHGLHLLDTVVSGNHLSKPILDQ